MTSLSAPVPVALVGVGPWGSRLLRALLDHPHFEVRSICDRDATRLAEAQGTLFAQGTVRCTTRLADVLADSSVEAVVVAVGPRDNGPVGLRVLAAGKHLLVEKPFATSLDVGHALVQEARQRGLVAAVGHVLRYHPLYRAVTEHLRGGELGVPLAIVGERVGPHRPRDIGPWWVLAPHDLSLLAHWLGTAHDVRVRGKEWLSATMSFAGGRFAQLLLGSHSERRRRTAIFAERGVLWIDEGGQPPSYSQCRLSEDVARWTRERAQGLVAESPAQAGAALDDVLSALTFGPPVVAPGDALTLELGAFARAVRTGHAPTTSLEASLPVLHMLVAGDPDRQRPTAPSVELSYSGELASGL